MEEFVKLTLSRMDIGQILDGLHERMLVWRATERLCWNSRIFLSYFWSP
jgi:hypothetical protein